MIFTLIAIVVWKPYLNTDYPLSLCSRGILSIPVKSYAMGCSLGSFCQVWPVGAPCYNGKGLCPLFLRCGWLSYLNCNSVILWEQVGSGCVVPSPPPCFSPPFAHENSLEVAEGHFCWQPVVWLSCWVSFSSWMPGSPLPSLGWSFWGDWQMQGCCWPKYFFLQEK